MGLVAHKVLFAGEVPSLAAIERVLCQRTGLTCRITTDPKHGFVITCREFYIDVDLRISGQVIDIEQPISMSVYFFDQLRESLIDLGGQRCNWQNDPESNAMVPTTPVRWRDQKWTLRLLDRHPVLTSIIWLTVVLPKALVRLVLRK